MKSLTVSTEVGVGGGIFGQDNLSIGLSTSENASGISEKIIRPVVIYRVFF